MPPRRRATATPDTRPQTSDALIELIHRHTIDNVLRTGGLNPNESMARPFSSVRDVLLEAMEHATRPEGPQRGMRSEWSLLNDQSAVNRLTAAITNASRTARFR